MEIEYKGYELVVGGQLLLISDLSNSRWGIFIVSSNMNKEGRKMNDCSEFPKLQNNTIL
jgi:hypothetical protein